MKEKKLLAHLGGVFIYSENPRELAEWYRDALGIRFEAHPDGSAFYASFHYLEPDTGKRAYLAWSVIKSKHRPRTEGKIFSVNYRVTDIEETIRHLRENDVQVSEAEVYPEGKFAWCEDPEGNHIELWEDTGVENGT